MQQDFAYRFDEETVEMRDFTIKSRNYDKYNCLPPYFKKYTDEISLKVAIWNQIQTKKIIQI